jgi:acyl CoA:acetate/3-ketoacid CoA transferase beta subunit
LRRGEPVDFTPQEVMVAAAAREIGDGEIVFIGMRLPLSAFALAKQTHAPGAIGLYECGLVRDTPAPELLYTMGDPPNIANALWATRMVNIMGLLAQGTVDVGFVGGAEIDRFGNLNTSYIRDPPSPPLLKGGQASANPPQGDRKGAASHLRNGEQTATPSFTEEGQASANPSLGGPQGVAPPISNGEQAGAPPFTKGGQGGVKLPGSGGAADIASLSKRLVIIMPHERRRLVERVSYITSPGYGDGNGWRQRAGLRQGGPSALITTRGLFRFDTQNCEAVLHSYHPGETVDSLLQDTGWELMVAPGVHETPAPTAEELAIIRRYDPQGFWTGRMGQSRGEP